jgi:hypothetical protein
LLLLFLLGPIGITQAQSLPESNDCTAPQGFVCGSKKGKIYKTIFVWTPMGPMPRQASKSCCVDSTPSMACDAATIGCNNSNQLL